MPALLPVLYYLLMVATPRGKPLHPSQAQLALNCQVEPSPREVLEAQLPQLEPQIRCGLDNEVDPVTGPV